MDNTLNAKVKIKYDRSNKFILIFTGLFLLNLVQVFINALWLDFGLSEIENNFIKFFVPLL